MKQLNNYNSWTASVTPHLEDGQIDYASLETLLRDQEAARNGIVLLGSTGEAISFSFNQKCAIAEFANNLALSVPIVVGIGGYCLEEQLAWMEFLENLHFDGYLIVTPTYSRPRRMGQTHWFRTLLDASSRPCILYNHPYRTGCHLSLDTLKDLEDHSRLWALKDASGSRETVETLLELFPQLEIFSGLDEKVYEYIKMGAKGVISVMGNTWPDAVARYVEICRKDTPTQCHSVWIDAANSVNQNNPVAIKRLLMLQKRIKTALTKPPLHPDDIDIDNELINADGLIKDWYRTLPVENHLAGVS
jgi:4-hydroxy-tetrahydrodipicolinate synthase